MNHSIEAFLPTIHGSFDIHSYPNAENPYAPDLVLIATDKSNKGFPLVRLHSECLTGDVFGSLRCDCGIQLRISLERIALEGGMIIYMRQEGRGIGLHHKIEAYQMQDSGLDTVQANEALGFEPDLRNYKMAIEVLKSFGMDSIRLLTNNPRKVLALQEAGINVVERIPLISPYNDYNRNYLNTKREKLGHLFPK